MSPNGKKNACQSLPLDVLSSLPENVIHDILICLPLRDAVRTSILSTKWRYKWCRISQFKLNLDFLQTEGVISPTIKFNNILYHLLTFHDGPISKFILSLHNTGIRPELDKLIYFLSRNGVQHLGFRLFGYNQYKMHSSFFRCSQLRHLSLHGCQIQIAPPAFKGFDRLISLKLSEVTISSIILECLISNCPLLEQLFLYHNVHSDVIEISAPMLRSFEFIEDDGFICLKSAPHLAKLSLSHVKYHEGSGSFFESLSALERLELNWHSLKFVAAVADKVPARLPFNLKCVEHLCLDSIPLQQLDSVLCVLCLIRSFPYLQYFEIQVIDEDDESPELECLELKAFSDVTFNHLKEVKLRHTIGSEPELQLIELLLVKSPVLERMLIEPLTAGDHASTTIMIPVVINSFRRASPKVQVVYNYHASFRKFERKNSRRKQARR